MALPWSRPTPGAGGTDRREEVCLQRKDSAAGRGGGRPRSRSKGLRPQGGGGGRCTEPNRHGQPLGSQESAPANVGSSHGWRQGRTIKQRRGRVSSRALPDHPAFPTSQPLGRPHSGGTRLTPGWKALPLREQQSHLSLSNPLPPLPVDGVRGGWPPPPLQVQWGM